MIADLDETLKQLLIQKGGLDPAAVDIRFDAPSRDKPARPTVNLYLYDVRENIELREMRWETQMAGNRKVRVKRPPLRMDLSYSVSCRASAVEEQHQLFWRVLQTLSANSLLPTDLLQGELKGQPQRVQTKVAQPDGVLKNPADLWSALQTEPAPSINLVAILDLDLDEETVTPMVFARVLKTAQLDSQTDTEKAKYGLPPGPSDWEASPIRLGGVVHTPDGRPFLGASIRLLGKQADGSPIQVGPTVQTDDSGRYILSGVPSGRYTLVIEVPGQAPQQRPVDAVVRHRGEPLPELVHEVEVPMPQKPA